MRHHVDSLVDAEGLPFRRFSVAAQNRLRNYPWPRNVRELRNMVKRLLILGGPEEISLSEVEAQLATDTADREPLVKQDLLAMPLREAREHFERAYLQQQLLLCGGKVGQLAKRVGMERTHLYRKLRSLGRGFSPVVDRRLSSEATSEPASASVSMPASRSRRCVRLAVSRSSIGPMRTRLKTSSSSVTRCTCDSNPSNARFACMRSASAAAPNEPACSK